MGTLPPHRLVDTIKDLLSWEKGTIRKPWRGNTTVTLVYPNSYPVGMANLGFQTVYHLLNSLPHTLCERAFLPAPEEQQELIRTQSELVTFESQHPLRQSDIIAFSLSFENDYLNILTILSLAKIPLLSSERQEGHPLIIAGGICPALNPEPLAHFIDLFIIGEAEEVLPPLITAYQHHRNRRRHKEELLTSLASQEGIYIPRFYTVTYHPSGTIESFTSTLEVPLRIKKKITQHLNHHPTCSTILTPHSEFSNMFLMEVSRGCIHRCNFCAISSFYHPYRRRSGETLKAMAERGLAQCTRIGLIGATLADHPSLTSLCSFITDVGGEFSPTSLRVDLVDEEFLALLKKCGHQTITLAPETGSERLRNVIKKNLSNDQILATLEKIARYQFRHVKLYFLIGLPTEKEEDIEQIVALTKKIKHHLTKLSPRSHTPELISLSVNPFVPKPWTPFQWHPLEHTTSLKSKLKKIQQNLRKEKGVIVTWDLPKWSYLQCLLSRGDRRVGKILLSAHRHAGSWIHAYRQVDINPDFYVYREIDLDEILPWDFIDHGVNKRHLASEYLQALRWGKGKVTGGLLKTE